MVECTAVGAPPPPAQGQQQRHLLQLAAIAAEEKVKTEEKYVKKHPKKEEDKTPSVQNPVVPWGEIDLGTVIKVKGRINAWWSVLQVEAIKVEVLRGMDKEVRAWDEVREFRESVLGRPWVVSREEEEKCRRGMEKELRRAKRRPGKEGKGKVKRDGGEKEGKRKDLERVKRLDGGGKRRKELESERLVEKKKVVYPSMAVRKAAAGKYDALGI